MAIKADDPANGNVRKLVGYTSRYNIHLILGCDANTYAIKLIEFFISDSYFRWEYTGRSTLESKERWKSSRILSLSLLL